MSKLLDYELYILKAYLKMPANQLLNHQFELENDNIAGYISRFIKGERFDKSFTAFSTKQLDIINPIISQNINTKEGKDLLSLFLLTKTVCNIMNKYQKNTGE